MIDDIFDLGVLTPLVPLTSSFVRLDLLELLISEITTWQSLLYYVMIIGGFSSKFLDAELPRESRLLIFLAFLGKLSGDP
mmetsp:Transcript_9861/g.14924  ORF Transcript_9861/g.14924 Transcript_9861/m.14924 type:complete len:80 (-) Transcript_9861:184-423(-)